LKRFWAVLIARNKEFIRDRSALAWNLLFPFFIVFGFAFMFSDKGQTVFKVAVLGSAPAAQAAMPFLATEHIEFIPIESLDQALAKLSRHQFDMLIAPQAPPRYWVNSSSPKGYLLERVLWGSGGTGTAFQKQVVEGEELRYVDWLLPGLLAVNMMFSCLFGVGYVIVRYRKTGVLRRFKATPLSAFEFLAAQVGSRLLLVMAVTVIIYVGTDIFLDFLMLGSYALLFLVFTAGALCLIALGLLFAARTASEELAGGLLNLVSWPMMLLSGAWFSLEGTPGWIRAIAQVFPLTHLIEAARAIMTEGAGLADILPQIAVLSILTLVFLAIGSAAFRWE
jgi:ABC-type multidrug transport system permease subunit